MVKEQKNSNDSIPEMNLNNKYKPNSPAVSEANTEMQKEMDKTRKELDKLKVYILKKYPFTQALSILPQQAMKFFIEEEEVPKETEKYIHLYWLVPEDQFKNLNKLKGEIVKELDKLQDKLKQKVWLQVKTPVDIWELCLDSKFEIISAIAMSFPVFDKGILGALRVSEIHKSLVLQKFEKYVVSYVLGGSLVRGDAVETSDCDVFVIINDTDVKKMPRLELLERLRKIIYDYIPEASALAGVKPNTLNVQIYLLTDFWQSVKDANPVMFTFIRDGVPIYDRGTFMPWKALLKMGKLKPSPEAIDMFMSMGDNTIKRAKRALMDILLQDIYWSVITPSQALLMLYGLPPPDIKGTYPQMKKIFVEKEKMLELKYVKILEEITIKYYKGYEHGKIKEITGKEIDRLLKGTDEYLKRLKELQKQIEKHAQQKTINQMHSELFELLKIVTGKTSQAAMIESFEKDFVKKGKFTEKYLDIIEDVVKAKQEAKKEKMSLHRADDIRKGTVVVINALIEYSQRKDLVSLEKGRMILKYGKNQMAELVNAGGKSFLIQDRFIKELKDKPVVSTMEEIAKALETQKGKQNVELNPKVFELVKKELGDFEILM